MFNIANETYRILFFQINNEIIKPFDTFLYSASTKLVLYVHCTYINKDGSGFIR